MIRNSTRTRSFFLGLTAVIILQMACGSRGDQREGIEVGLITMEHGGLPRTYRLMLPEAYARDVPVPLVLALHGGGGNSAQMCNWKGGLPDLLEQERFILVCPDGIEEHWNDGRGVQRYRAQREDIDDVGFMLALVEKVSNEFNVHSSQVYVTGASNGGMMSYRLACEASDTFAAAAALIASMPTDLDCRPSQPISMLIMNGTEDPMVPFEGGQVHFYQRELGEVLSTHGTVDSWVRANSCVDKPIRSELPDSDPSDGTRILQESYSDCADGTRVVLYEIQGGGHTWPGGTQYLPEFAIGTVSRDAHAGELIWDFLQDETVE